MAIEIRQVGPDSLDQYGQIPMRHRVESVFCVDEIDGGLGGFKLTEESVANPYIKDYDDFNPGGVTEWTKKFDVSNWLFLMAFDGDKAVGGATVAIRSPKIQMLEGRDDLAVLWDIRVHPDCSRQGIGSRLLDQAADWSRKQGCKQLKIETQNINVPACRFYAARGCKLLTIDRHAYSEDPRVAHETMLIWFLDL